MPRVPVVVEALFQPRLKRVYLLLLFCLCFFRPRKGSLFFVGALSFVFAFMFVSTFIPLSFSEDWCHSNQDVLAAYIFDHNRVHLSRKQAGSISGEIVRQSVLLGVPVDLGVAIMEKESSFNPEAINRLSGDYGLFQIHYSFWKKHFARKKGSRLWALSPKDLYQINVNVRVGMMIIRHDLILSHGSVSGMIGLYSGRRGDERERYVLSVLVNEARLREYEKRAGSLSQLRWPN